jgi:hypothetical protein
MGREVEGGRKGGREETRKEARKEGNVYFIIPKARVIPCRIFN